MGGHFDSWDVGQGAHDDGCSCMAAWQALTILKELGLRPRRTLRVVLWTNEENGLRGGMAYREALAGVWEVAPLDLTTQPTQGLAPDGAVENLGEVIAGEVGEQVGVELAP